MKIFALKIIFITSFLLSCENSIDVSNDVLPVQKDTFENMIVELTADTNKVILDSIVTITTSCIPQFNGTGLISLIGDGMIDSAIHIIVNPLQDTLMHLNSLSTPYVELPVNFTANEKLTVNWEIIFKTPISYSFRSTAIFDSIAIVDSSELYNYEPVDNYHYEYNYANSFPTLVFTYP